MYLSPIAGHFPLHMYDRQPYPVLLQLLDQKEYNKTNV